MRLDGKNGDHKIVAEPGVAKERAMFWVAPSQPAEQSQGAECHRQEGDEESDGKQCVGLKSGCYAATGGCIWVEPLGGGPKKAKACLNCRAKAGLARGQFVKQQSEIQRHNPP